MAGPPDGQVEDILEQFRQQWRRELQQTPQAGSSGTLQEADTAATAASSPGLLLQESNLDAGTSPQSRKAELLSRPPPATSTSASPAAGSRNASPTRGASTPGSKALPAAQETISTSRPPRGSTEDRVTTAVELYSAAVDAEREGRLNDALRAYRSAFRKDENVDKTYHRVQMSEKEREKQKVSGDASAQEDKQMNDLVFSYQRTLQLDPDYERAKQLKGRMMTDNYVERLLKMIRENPYIPEAERAQKQTNGQAESPAKSAKIKPNASGAPDDAVSGHEASITPHPNGNEPIIFIPRKQEKPCPIARLPDEILLHILSILAAPSPNARAPDIRSLERGFSLVCRKTRILTLQSRSLWRDICLSVYKPPLMLDPTRRLQEAQDAEHRPSSACLDLAATKYSLDWRLMWIEQPRIRTDGVYISQITYLRRGAADASFYDPTHVVTYYRYLVFLPSGDVVSLLSHDIPSQVVPNLLSSNHGSNSKMHQAGYTVGKWRLVHLPPKNDSEQSSSATIVQCSSLEDPRITNVTDIKYSFKLICRLKSTSRGKMNKLEMLQLLTLNHRTGEEGPIAVKQVNGTLPSFYFSRVMSYD